MSSLYYQRVCIMLTKPVSDSLFCSIPEFESHGHDNDCAFKSHAADLTCCTTLKLTNYF